MLVSCVLASRATSQVRDAPLTHFSESPEQRYQGLTVHHLPCQPVHQIIQFIDDSDIKYHI